MSDLDDAMAKDDELGGWRREVARLRADLRTAETEKAELRQEKAKLEEENRQLREMLAQIAATAMSGAKA